MIETSFVFHETSFLSGTKTWQVEKYWNEETLNLFLQARQTGFWHFSQSAPFRRSQRQKQGFKRIAWVLKDKQSSGDTSSVSSSSNVWAEAHGFFKRFIDFQVFIGFSVHNEIELSDDELEEHLSSLVTGIFLSSRCDHLKVCPLHPRLEKVVERITESRAKYNMAIAFVDTSYWNLRKDAPIAKSVVIADLTKADWFECAAAQPSRVEQEYLQKKMKTLLEQERSRTAINKKKPRRSLLGRIFRPSI